MHASTGKCREVRELAERGAERTQIIRNSHSTRVRGGALRGESEPAQRQTTLITILLL